MRSANKNAASSTTIEESLKQLIRAEIRRLVHADALLAIDELRAQSPSTSSGVRGTAFSVPLISGAHS